jgi:hypothetical protein
MPATGNFVLDKGFDAAAAITKFRAVKMSADETVTPITAITDVAVGVEQFGVSAGEILKGKGASVRTMGITEMEVSANVATGALVSAGSDGRAKTAATGERYIGQCVKGTAAGAGSRISVLLDLAGGLAP